ncbi:6-phospho-beta-glucosidase [Jiangella gansuensis]|uniref:6-phospho-beta-glucosidase n=1 Tax=Jiangella gansuensis TaxID=281473 RepID=UPI00047EFDEA|nr:6-phospho-beta-glucosidase [Jiangella gansuensis]
MKIVVVGGASTYTPELIDGFARQHESLPIDEVVLVDPATDRLALIAGMGERMLRAGGRPYRLAYTEDLRGALDGATVVLIQIRVGGQRTRANDESFPLESGCIGQETTGAGGLAKAMRTVPVVLDIAAQVAEHAPDAWIVDFTNPVGIVTRALLDEGHRAVGLCNVAIGMQHFFARLLETEPDEVRSAHVGLNHLTWEAAVDHRGEDVLPRLIATRSEDIGHRVTLPAAVIDHLGMVPSYYLRYYYHHDDVLRELLDGPSRAEEVMRIERELLDHYADPSVDQKPEALSRRGGALYSESAVQLMSSLLGSGSGVHAVNARNAGALDFLPSEAVIEANAEVGGGHIRFLPTPALPPSVRGLIAHVSAYEKLAVDAAVRGGRRRVVDALLAHPLIGQWSLAEQLADRLIHENSEHLAWA